MTTVEYLDNALRERLGGDKSRFPELFSDSGVFSALQRLEQDSDWYHFHPKTFDGCYFVQGVVGYEVYQQERGVRSERKVFAAISDAARYFFTSYW